MLTLTGIIGSFLLCTLNEPFFDLTVIVLDVCRTVWNILTFSITITNAGTMNEAIAENMIYIDGRDVGWQSFVGSESWAFRVRSTKSMTARSREQNQTRNVISRTTLSNLELENYCWGGGGEHTWWRRWLGIWLADGQPYIGQMKLQGDYKSMQLIGRHLRRARVCIQSDRKSIHLSVPERFLFRCLKVYLPVCLPTPIPVIWKVFQCAVRLPTCVSACLPMCLLACLQNFLQNGPICFFLQLWDFF